MKFQTTKQRNEYFDILIDAYHKLEYEQCIKYIQALSMSEERELLYYLYTLDRSPHLFSFVLDAIY